MRGHRLTQVYADMMWRCYRPSHPAYKYYGARGIGVCAEWRESREAFFRWALVGWQRGLFLDRENNDENYSPDNCRWVTVKVSNRNRSCAKLTLPLAAMIKDMADWGVNQEVIGVLFGVGSSMVSLIHVGKSWTDAAAYARGELVV
jgi:hypothetical protein